MNLRPYQNDLIERARISFNEGKRAPCIVSPCGSGKSIIAAELARCATIKGNRVLFIVHRRELCEQIEETFKNWGVDMSLCTVGMVQTVCRRLDSTQNPSVIIVDECHHVLANSYRKIIEYFPNAFLVGFTATPVRLNGGGLGEVHSNLIVGLSVKELIAMGNLSTFRYYAPRIIDTSKLRIKNGDFKQSDIEEYIALNAKIVYGNMISHYKKLSDGKQAICYCSSIAQSKRAAEEFCNAGIVAKHLDGDTPKAERKAIIEQFRNGEVMILCNVDLISEGFDVPDCNTAILLRPTQSLSLYIQQSMRCMRYKEGKEAVIIDHVGNVNRFGLPDEDRIWRLDAEKRTKPRMDEVSIRQCAECFCVMRAEEECCPMCGWKPEKKEIKETVCIDTDLVEVESTGFVLDYRKPEDCKNMKELHDLAKNLGYKKGWAYYQGKRLGLI